MTRMNASLRLLSIALVAAASLLPPASDAARQDRGSTMVTVKTFVPRGHPGPRCDRVFALPRRVPAPGVLTGAVRSLLAGPTRAERRAGYGGWFSSRTNGMLRSARVVSGIAYIDFRNFSRVIPNASSSCGSFLLLAQLNRTATQFPTVRRAVYSFNGSRSSFYEWLQRSPPLTP
jgi:hypothetical protein